jgi:hypothetical protein
VYDARMSACDALVDAEDGDVFVLLGARVAAAFDMEDLPLWKSKYVLTRHGVLKFIRLPHPSGRCREWNDKNSRARARRAMSPHLNGVEIC